MSKKRSLCILCTTGRVGGTERLAASVAREFLRRSWLVNTLLPADQESLAALDWWQAQNIAVHRESGMPLPEQSRSWGQVKALRETVRRFKSDVVHVHYGSNYISIKDIIAIRLASPGSRCVAQVNHPLPWTPENGDKKRSTKLGAMLSHRVVAISEATRTILLEAGVPDWKITVVPCGAQPPVSLPTVAEARERLGLPPEAIVIGCTARLVAEKGVGELIAAVGKLYKEGGAAFTHLRLIVAGEGPQLEELTRQAAALLPGQNVMRGRLAELDDFYAACDVFVLPSHMEGFGLVYVEAAWHGVPSIGTLVGGIPDAINDGVTGLLIPVSNQERLVAAIRELVTNGERRRQMGNAARQRALRDFTEAAMGDRYEKVFLG